MIDSTSSGPGMIGANPKLGFHVLIFHFGILCVPDKYVFSFLAFSLYFVVVINVFSVLLLIKTVMNNGYIACLS